MNAPQEPLTLSVEEAGRRLGISRNLAYFCARNGTLPVLRLGRRLRVPTAALDSLLKSGSDRTSASRVR